MKLKSLVEGFLKAKTRTSEEEGQVSLSSEEAPWGLGHLGRVHQAGSAGVRKTALWIQLLVVKLALLGTETVLLGPSLQEASREEPFLLCAPTCSLSPGSP